MRKIPSCIFKVFCLLFFYGCSSPTENASTTIHNPNASILLEVDNSIPFTWPEELIIEKISFLESDPEHLISSIRKLVVSPDGKSYFIFDENQGKIFVFEQSGKAKAIFDHQGEGPGEYMEITDVQIDFEKEVIEVLDYRKLKKYNLTTFEYISAENLNHLPKDKNFRNFVRIDDVLYLWTNLPPNQLVGEDELGSHHLIRVENGDVSFHVEKKYGVIHGYIFHPSSSKNEFNLPSIVGSTDIIRVSRDSVYTKYKFDFGNKGIPLAEMMNFWEKRHELLGSEYYKPPQNIWETGNHLFFQFTGNMVGYNVLFDKNTNSIKSIGKIQDKVDPVIIFSDSEFIYAYLFPGIIVDYLENGGDLTTSPFFKNLDTSLLKKEDNPIIVKFKLP
jgi:hypothetical protein